LVSAEELTRAEDCGDYYRVHCQRDQNYDEYFIRGISETIAREGYTSENAPQLSVRETEQLLMELPEIHRDLEQWLPQGFAQRRAA
jgi:UDP-glucose 4-epimerase